VVSRPHAEEQATRGDIPEPDIDPAAGGVSLPSSPSY
jgi:hypothetical protein